MSGKDGSRGYLVQSIVGVILSLKNENWDEICLEPDENEYSDKVDIALKKASSKKVIQVKSSRNQIQKSHVKKWADELADSIDADEYSLILVGDCAEGVIKLKNHNRVIIEPPLQLNLESLVDQTSFKIGKLIERAGIFNLTTQEIETIAKSLITDFTILSTKGEFISKEKFYQIIVDAAPKKPVPIHGQTIDTGQVLSVSEFIEKNNRNNFSTSFIATGIEDIFIDENIESVENSSITLITGPSGIGKTHLSLSLAERLKNRNENLNVFCIHYRGADLVSDLQSKLNSTGDYLILIDDANRLDNRLDYILSYLKEQSDYKNYKIIATVRDYAIPLIESKIDKRITNNVIELDKVSNPNITNIVKKHCSISKKEILSNIYEIANGNPRLAIMMGIAIKKSNDDSVINNPLQVYEHYFSCHDSVNYALKNKSLSKVLSAISFFRVVDNYNQKHVFELIEMEECEFLECVKKLNGMELVDVYEDNIVKISDQILSIYLFYKSVFESKSIDFSVIVERYFPSHRNEIFDTINPILKIMEYKKTISVLEDCLKKTYQKINFVSDYEEAVFVNAFWFVLKAEGLSFCKKQISNGSDNLTLKNHDFESSQIELIVDTLVNYRQYGADRYFKMSLDLILEAIRKFPSEIENIISQISEKYIFTRDDHFDRYKLQNLIIDRLYDFVKKHQDSLSKLIFTKIAIVFFKIKCEKDVYSIDKNIVKIETTNFQKNEYLTSLRCKIINLLEIIFSVDLIEDEICMFIRDYISNIYSQQEFVMNEVKLIEDAFFVNICNKKPSNIILAQDFYYLCAKYNIGTNDNIKARFKSELSEFYDAVVISDKVSFSKCKNYEDEKDLKKETIFEYVKKGDLELCKKFISNASILVKEVSERDSYIVKQGVEIMLSEISKESSNIMEILEFYYSYDYLLNVDYKMIVFNLVKRGLETELFHALDVSSFSKKENWILFYLLIADEGSINKEKAERLIKSIELCGDLNLLIRFEYFEKYEKINPLINDEVLSILLKKSKTKVGFGIFLFHLFSDNSSFFGNWFTKFKNKDNVFEAYLRSFSAENVTDNSGKALKLLIRQKPVFLFDFIEYLYEKSGRLSDSSIIPNLNFLWDEDNYIELIENLGLMVSNKEKNCFRYSNTFFDKLFKDANGESAENNKRINFLEKSISANSNDIGYANLLVTTSEIFTDYKVKLRLVKAFLSTNHDLKSFEYLMTNNRFNISENREAELMTENVLLDELNKEIDDIELIEHSLYIEDLIEHNSFLIAKNKRSKFIKN